jgi:hypothetical protein
MGRYYNGDIEGKFWFAVQSSTAAKRFGGEMYSPSYVEFYFDENDLPSINEELGEIEDKLGPMKQKMDAFFKDNKGYNDQMLLDAGIDHKMLEDYADFGLGIKIRDCVMAQGECKFEAEI